MARKRSFDTTLWPSLTIEGHLIAPAMLQKISKLETTEQRPENYRLRKGISIKDEISTAFRVGQVHYEDYRKKSHANSKETLSYLEGLLEEVFGFDDLEREDWQNKLVAGKRVSIDLVSRDENLDSFAARLVFKTEESIWRLVSNGQVVRLLRLNESLTRPAYIDFDLGHMFGNEDIASFSVFWLLIHRTRFGNSTESPAMSFLEYWREEGISEGEIARDQLAGQITVALSTLGTGFIEANSDLFEELRSGKVQLIDWFNELLRLIYRLTFIMVAEDRNLLHPFNCQNSSRKLYEAGYSLKNLRTKSVKLDNWNRHYDYFEGVKIILEALSNGNGEKSLAIPAFGGLFDQNNLPTLRTAKLYNSSIMKAIFCMTWIKQENVIIPVNWKDMKIEELGSIYESLLDLSPRINFDKKTFYFVSTATNTKGSQRRTTGSYYTPDELVSLVLKSTLDPIIERTKKNNLKIAEALLKLTVIDPACGSGHFLLSAAHRIAKEAYFDILKKNQASPDYKKILREVIQKCIFGVDLNPMAIEITKFVLWLESLSPGYPLGFLDAQIKCGDSLLGLFSLDVLKSGIPDSAYKPLFGDTKKIANEFKQSNLMEKTGQGKLNLEAEEKSIVLETERLTAVEKLRNLPEETFDDIRKKMRNYTKIGNDQDFQRVQNASNLYMAAFLLPKRPSLARKENCERIPTTNDVWSALEAKPLPKSVRSSISFVKQKKVFHWVLEFPDIILKQGGFDAVIGNPPWERIELNELEFFANRSEKIATNYNSAQRKKQIAELENSVSLIERNIFDEYIRFYHLSKAVSNFVRTAENSRFPLSGRGKVNTFALFTELFTQLRKPNGLIGVLVPTGFATDSTTAPLFTWVIKNKFLVSLYDFQNNKKFFRDVHAQFKFSAVIIGDWEGQAECYFFLTDVEEIFNSERKIVLENSEFELLNPNTNTSPVVRSKSDKDILIQVYRSIPVLVSDRQPNKGNGWQVEFLSMFNMSTDSKFFRTRNQLEDEGYERHGMRFIHGTSVYLPLYEAKMIHLYNHKYSNAETLDKRPFNAPWPQTSDRNMKDACYEVFPWYWVDSKVYEAKVPEKYDKGYWIGCRDVSNSTSDRTVMASVITRTALSGGIRVFVTKNSAQLDSVLLGNLNSLVLDYITRMKLGGNHLAFHVIKQLPIIPTFFYDNARMRFVVSKVLELSYTSNSLKPFALELGYKGEPFTWDAKRRAYLKAELDAFYARAYGLNRVQLRYILDPTDVKGSNYPSESFRVMKKNEIKEYGEYRTQRLVVEAWDRFEADSTFEKLGM